MGPSPGRLPGQLRCGIRQSSAAAVAAEGDTSRARSGKTDHGRRAARSDRSRATSNGRRAATSGTLRATSGEADRELWAAKMSCASGDSTYRGRQRFFIDIIMNIFVPVAPTLREDGSVFHFIYYHEH